MIPQNRGAKTKNMFQKIFKWENFLHTRKLYRNYSTKWNELTFLAKENLSIWYENEIKNRITQTIQASKFFLFR